VPTTDGELLNSLRSRQLLHHCTAHLTVRGKEDIEDCVAHLVAALLQVSRPQGVAKKLHRHQCSRTTCWRLELQGGTQLTESACCAGTFKGISLSGSLHWCAYMAVCFHGQRSTAVTGACLCEKASTWHKSLSEASNLQGNHNRS
jgi:hypothetical protein